MPAVHPLQDAVVKGLDSHADTVHTELQQSLHILMALLYDIFRIDLDGKLIVRTAMPAGMQSIEQMPEYRKGQHRWGAASYI